MTIRTSTVLAACMLLFHGSAGAGSLGIAATDSNGTALADVVVRIDALDATSRPGNVDSAKTHYIDQRDEQFVPYVEVFRPNDSVVFRNSDSTRHHAYSFAPEAAFEMVLKPGESSQPIVLEQPGVIAVGCNIHDQMITYLVVADSRWQGKTGADGRWQLDALPPGHYRIGVWHPRLRPGQAGLSREVDVAPNQQTTMLDFALRVMADLRGHDDPERVDY